MDKMKVVIFGIGREKFAVDIQRVSSVIEYREITKVPEVKPEVEGVIDLRGEVIPIINLAERLHCRQPGKKEAGKFMIVSYRDLSAGFLVDEASRVMEIERDDIQSPPSMIHASDLEWISGIINLDGEIVVLLDLERLIDLVA